MTAEAIAGKIGVAILIDPSRKNGKITCDKKANIHTQAQPENGLKGLPGRRWFRGCQR
jgi:hypothetical protein